MRLDATFEEADQAMTRAVRVEYVDCPKSRGQASFDTLLYYPQNLVAHGSRQRADAAAACCGSVIGGLAPRGFRGADET